MMAEMDNLPFDLSNMSREDMDRMMSDYNSDAMDIRPLFTKGGARAAVQGLTFGTGDEVEAAVRSLLQDGVSFNDALTNVAGLSSLTSVGGRLYIYRNEALLNLDPLSSLTSVGGDLTIQINETLTDIDGLSSLTSVGGDLTINYNPALCQSSVDAFVAACMIGGSTSAEDNDGGC